MSDCIFCKIAKGDIPSTVVYEDDEFVAILDKFPANLGHMLVIPKEHIENVFELPSEKTEKIFAIVANMAKKMKQNLEFDGLNIVQNNGIVAGQSVFHFHIHLIPRYDNDNVNIIWNHKEASNEELNEIKKKKRRTYTVYLYCFSRSQKPPGNYKVLYFIPKRGYRK
jgi:histidine triad (HIT) family protein